MLRELGYFTLGVIGVIGTLLFRERVPPKDPVRELALLLPLDGEFSRDSRDSQLTAELALMMWEQRTVRGAASLRVYNTRQVAGQDEGAIRLAVDLRGGAVTFDAIYGYQTTDQLRLGVTTLEREVPLDASPLTISTIGASQELKLDGSVQVLNRGARNDELANLVASFVKSWERGCVTVAYEKTNGYERDLATKINNLTPVNEFPDVSSERAECVGQKLLIYTGGHERFLDHIRLAREQLGPGPHALLGTDNLLSREFVFGAEYNHAIQDLKSRKWEVYLLTPVRPEWGSAGFRKEFRERYHYVSNIHEQILYTALYADLNGDHYTRPEPVIRSAQELLAAIKRESSR